MNLCKKSINEQGLLVLAKSDLKLSYLMSNNSNSIITLLRSNLVGMEDKFEKNAAEISPLGESGSGEGGSGLANNSSGTFAEK